VEDTSLPIRVRYYPLLTLAAIAKRAGKATRQVVDAANQQAADNVAIHIRMVTLLSARLLMATTDVVLRLFERTPPDRDQPSR
jgi:hypothetical protein